MRKRTWLQVIIHWRHKYAQDKKGIFNPAEIRCSRDDSWCRKCYSTWKVTRHHKGHEYLFALIDEERYAPRYIKFLDEDVVPLCRRCHQKIHQLYRPIIRELNKYISSCFASYDDEKMEVTWRFKPESEVLESYRMQLVRKCDYWLKHKMKKPTPSARTHANKKSKAFDKETKRR